MNLFTNLQSGTEVSLVVFPHAGGGPSQYSQIVNYCPKNWNVSVLHLPGREQKYSQDYYTKWSQLIQDVSDELKPILKGKITIFVGHSMGSWVAFESLLNIESKIKIEQSLLVVSGIAPQSKESLLAELAENLNNEELLEKLSDLDGVPKELLENKDFSRIYLRSIREDLKLMLDSQKINNRKLKTNILAMAAKNDPLVNFTDICEWKKNTENDFNLIYFPGGHFSILQNFSKWMSLIVKKIGSAS